jgi:hypothetical protein
MTYPRIVGRGHAWHDAMQLAGPEEEQQASRDAGASLPQRLRDLAGRHRRFWEKHDERE